MSLKPTDLKIENFSNEKNVSILFVGFLFGDFVGNMLDECINWRNHVRTVESIIARNICLLYRARRVFARQLQRP